MMTVLISNYRELNQRLRRRQRERQKAMVYIFSKKNNFARASRFFVHFLAFVAPLRLENA